MPPKPKLFKNKNPTKPPKINQENLPQPSTSQTNSSTEIIPNQEQFESELCWCIQQLRTVLISGKLNNKQVQDYSKALNTLMSNTAPIVKKRQVMRLSFGDYREKMAAEEKRMSKNATNMKLKSATPNKKTIFLKKSFFSSAVDNNFKFNFTIQDGKIEESTPNISINNEVLEPVNTVDNFHFTPSNNTFRFDFQVENEK